METALEGKRRILVTGATGFVGRALCTRLLAGDFSVRGTLLAHENSSSLVSGVEPVQVEPLSHDTAWAHAVAGIDTVIHLAARVHIMDDPSADPQEEFKRVNADGTAHLAREAARAGVRRMVFMSSIKVNGEGSTVPYTESSPEQPTDPYGISKWLAEQALRQVEGETGLEVVVLRPTLVYGPGVRANFLNMMKVVQRGVPLPLASIVNLRSLIYIGNLVDAITVCASDPRAAGEMFLVSDGEDVSVPQLLRQTAAALGAPARLFPVPTTLMRIVGVLTGKSAQVARLTGSLTVENSKIRKKLGWCPPYTLDEGLRSTAAWYLSARGAK